MTIPHDLEQDLIQLILDHQQEKKYLGDVSKRLSVKKLTVRQMLCLLLHCGIVKSSYQLPIIVLYSGMMSLL